MRAPLYVVATLTLSLTAACVIPSRRNDPGPPQPQPFPPQPTAYPPATTPPPATTTAPAATVPPPATTAPVASAAPTTPAKPPVFRLPRLPGRTTTPATKGCGELAIDGVTVPFDCFNKDYGKVAGAQKAPAPTPPKQPVDYIDHRLSKLEGPTRHQRKVGNGVAHAAASAIDQGLIRNGGGFLPVSAMHLWARSPKAMLGDLLQASLGKGIASEATAPYNDDKACLWASPEASAVCKPPKHEAPGAADVDPAPFARLVGVLEIDGTNGEAIRDALLRDLDVLFALRIDADAWKSVVKSPDAEPLLPDYAGTTSVHTVNLAGFARQDGQWFYLVKNSWGPGWGRDGYAWILESTLKKNFIAAYTLQVSVASGPTLGPVGPHACPPGQLPDAVTKACAAACPNNTPAKSGACK